MQLCTRSVFSVVCCAIVSAVWATADTYFVDCRSPITCSHASAGTSWAFAYPNLQCALDVAVAGDIIKIGGNDRYAPLTPGVWPACYYVPGGERTDTFEIPDGVTLQAHAGLSDVDPNAPDPNATQNVVAFLTGDISLDDDYGIEGNSTPLSDDYDPSGANSFHVMTMNGAGSTTVLSRLVIAGGVANGEGFHEDRGAGLYLFDSDPQLVDCHIRHNGAISHGGGVYCSSGAPSFTGGSISQNGAGHGGGGTFVDGSAPVFDDILSTQGGISENRASATSAHGGGLQFEDSQATLSNVSVFANLAGELDMGELDCNASVLTRGGGISLVNSELAATESEISKNRAGAGGGIFIDVLSTCVIYDSAGTEYENEFFGNGACIDGGAVWCVGEFRCEDATYSSNAAYRGGAVSVASTGQCVGLRCLFVDNDAGEVGLGGAVSVFGVAHLERGLFQRNRSSRGGAVYATSDQTAHVSLMNNGFQFNTAYRGGAIALENVDENPSPAGTFAVSNSVFWRNRGANAYHEPDPNNPGIGGGVHNDGGAITTSNCMFWHNRDDLHPNGLHESAQVYAEGGTTAVTWCCVQDEAENGNGPLGVTNIDYDPLCYATVNPGDPNTDAAWEEFQLTSQSILIDAGNNNLVIPDLADVDQDTNLAESTPLDAKGAHRFFNVSGATDVGVAGGTPGHSAIVDIGMFEFGGCYIEGAEQVFGCEQGDVDGDCDVDLSDLAILLKSYGSTSGKSRSDGDLDGDGDVDLTDLAMLLTVFGTDCGCTTFPPEIGNDCG